MLDFSLFMNLHFLFLAISTIILYVWFIVPYIYVAEHMIRNHYSENEASLMLSVIGVANTIGMVRTTAILDCLKAIKNLNTLCDDVVVRLHNFRVCPTSQKIANFHFEVSVDK